MLAGPGDIFNLYAVVYSHVLKHIRLDLQFCKPDPAINHHADLHFRCHTLLINKKLDVIKPCTVLCTRNLKKRDLHENPLRISCGHAL